MILTVQPRHVSLKEIQAEEDAVRQEAEFLTWFEEESRKAQEAAGKSTKPERGGNRGRGGRGGSGNRGGRGGGDGASKGRGRGRGQQKPKQDKETSK